MSSLITILKQNKTLVLIDQLLYSGINFIVTLLVAKLLNISEFGIFSTIVIVLFLLISITNAFVIQPFQVSVFKESNTVSYSNFLLTLQIVLVAFIAVTAISVNIFMPNNTYHLNYVLLYGSGLLFHDYFRKYYLAKTKILKVLTIDTIIALSQLLIIIVLKNRTEINISIVLSSLSISYAISNAYSLLIYKPSFKSIKQWKPFIKYHIKEGKWLSLVSFVQWGSSNFFVLTIGLFINIEALAAFRLVQSLFGIINIVFQTFENYVLPTASKINLTSTELSKKYIKKTSIQSAILIGIFLIVLFIFSKEVISLFSDNKYQAYDYVLKGMCILYFIIFIGYPIRLSIRMLLLNKSFFIGYLLAFAFSILFFNILLKNWQLNGVIIGLILNQLIMMLFWTYKLKKQNFYLWR